VAANRSKNHSVGYGSPPRHTRFKPGQSGNPKGRPRGSGNIATLLERALTERVVITENGKRRSISKLEASFKQLVNIAASGDLAAMRQLYTLIPWLEGKLNESEDPHPTVSAADEAAMARVRERLLTIAERISHEKKEPDTE
jgi:hypothetical protein